MFPILVPPRILELEIMRRNKTPGLDFKLRELGIASFHPKKSKVSPKGKIEDFEKKYQIELQPDYRQFVSRYCPAVFKKPAFYSPLEKSPKTPEDALEEITVFYGLSADENNLIRIKEAYANRMPDFLIPIADTPDGDQVCLCVKGDCKDNVYLWDHDCESKSPNDEPYENLYLIANTFSDFIQSFRVVEHEFTDDEIEGVDVWLDEDLSD